MELHLTLKTDSCLDLGRALAVMLLEMHAELCEFEYTTQNIETLIPNQTRHRNQRNSIQKILG